MCVFCLFVFVPVASLIIPLWRLLTMIGGCNSIKLTPILFVCFFPLPRTDKQPLAPGVTQKDVDLYREIRERAARAVCQQPATSFATPVRGGGGGTAAQPFGSMISPTSAAMAAQERCPAAIEFGPWDIETWYSSPFPQEYAR